MFNIAHPLSHLLMSNGPIPQLLPRHFAQELTTSGKGRVTIRLASWCGIVARKEGGSDRREGEDGLDRVQG